VPIKSGFHPQVMVRLLPSILQNKCKVFLQVYTFLFCHDTTIPQPKGQPPRSGTMLEAKLSQSLYPQYAPRSVQMSGVPFTSITMVIVMVADRVAINVQVYGCLTMII
jgi:hypothetical protein